MSEPARRVGRTLGSLALALLNATLILLALCLFLGWKMLSEGRQVAAGWQASLGLAQPLQSEVLALRGDLAGLRADLEAVRAEAYPAPAVTALVAQVGAIDARVEGTLGRLNALIGDPGLLVDRAVDRAALQIRSGIAACTGDGA